MSVTLFVVPQLVVRAFNREPNIDSNIIYLFFASILPLLWILVPKEIVAVREVNFIQHSVGGGVAVGFVCIYLIKSLKEKYPLLGRFPVQIILLYALVSSLGVANELLEFSLDILKVGVFSSDRYDTWYDLVANTCGAFVIFFLFLPIIYFSDRNSK